MRVSVDVERREGVCFACVWCTNMWGGGGNGARGFSPTRRAPPRCRRTIFYVKARTAVAVSALSAFRGGLGDLNARLEFVL